MNNSLSKISSTIMKTMILKGMTCILVLLQTKFFI